MAEIGAPHRGNAPEGGPVERLTQYTSYKDAQAHFARQKLWDLFDGTKRTAEHRA